MDVHYPRLGAIEAIGSEVSSFNSLFMTTKCEIMGTDFSPSHNSIDTSIVSIQAS